MFDILCVMFFLLFTSLFVFVYFNHKVKEQKHNSKQILSHYTKVLNDTDKAFTTNLHLALTPNVQHALNLLVEMSLRKIVSNAAYSPLYKQRLNELIKTNTIYRIDTSGKDRLKSEGVDASVPVFNLSLVP